MSKERGAGTVEDVEEVPTGSGLEGPGFFRYERWWPIRVAFTRWRVSAPVTQGREYLRGGPAAKPSWDQFGGYRHHPHWGKFDSTPSFLEECDDHLAALGYPLPSHGRNLHREEMNLHPAGEYLEMYDRLVGRMWRERPDRMEFLNDADPLPLVHIIVNKSDGPGKGHFDLFFPHELHFGGNDTVRYKNDHVFSGQHQQARQQSAEAVGACPHCAIKVDQMDSEEDRLTQGTVYHIKSGPNSRFPIDEIYGYREFGQEITKDMAKENRSGGIIVHLPPSNHVDRIFLPRRVVHELFGKGERWSQMKIFPPLP